MTTVGRSRIKPLQHDLLPRSVALMYTDKFNGLGVFCEMEPKCDQFFSYADFLGANQTSREKKAAYSHTMNCIYEVYHVMQLTRRIHPRILTPDGRLINILSHWQESESEFRSLILNHSLNEVTRELIQLSRTQKFQAILGHLGSKYSQGN